MDSLVRYGRWRAPARRSRVGWNRRERASGRDRLVEDNTLHVRRMKDVKKNPTEARSAQMIYMLSPQAYCAFQSSCLETQAMEQDLLLAAQCSCSASKGLRTTVLIRFIQDLFLSRRGS